MKVYVAMYHSYEIDHIEGIYKTKEAAEKRVADGNAAEPYHGLGESRAFEEHDLIESAESTPCDVPTILAMMRAASEHMDALRAAVERLAAENAELRTRCGETP